VRVIYKNSVTDGRKKKKTTTMSHLRKGLVNNRERFSQIGGEGREIRGFWTVLGDVENKGKKIVGWRKTVHLSIYGESRYLGSLQGGGKRGGGGGLFLGR